MHGLRRAKNKENITTLLAADKREVSRRKQRFLNKEKEGGKKIPISSARISASLTTKQKKGIIKRGALKKKKTFRKEPGKIWGKHRWKKKKAIPDLVLLVQKKRGGRKKEVEGWAQQMDSGGPIIQRKKKSPSNSSSPILPERGTKVGQMTKRFLKERRKNQKETAQRLVSGNKANFLGKQGGGKNTQTSVSRGGARGGKVVCLTVMGTGEGWCAKGPAIPRLAQRKKVFLG